MRRSSIGRDAVRTPVSGGRSPIPAYDDKPLSASWAGSDFNDGHHRHVGKKLIDLEPISTPIPESGRDFMDLCQCVFISQYYVAWLTVVFRLKFTVHIRFGTPCCNS